MPFRTAAALSALLLALPLPAVAAGDGARHADAHEHGVSQLQIALDGKTVEAELRAPGADLAGFEHAAESEADRAAEAAALAALRDPAGLFGLAGCAAAEVEAHVDRDGHDAHGHDAHDEEHGREEHEDHAADGHAEEDHDHDADHEEHEEHAHEDHENHDDHDDHAGAEGGHSEYHAIYRLTCDAAPAALDLSGFFAAFPNAREVEVQAITAAGAAAAEATRDAPRVALD